MLNKTPYEASKRDSRRTSLTCMPCNKASVSGWKKAKAVTPRININSMMVSWKYVSRAMANTWDAASNRVRTNTMLFQNHSCGLQEMQQRVVVKAKSQIKHSLQCAADSNAA